MESISSAVSKAVDVLPAVGAKGKGEPFSGWGVKIMLVAGLIEVIMSLGSWKRFGVTLVVQLVISILGLWFNRNSHEVGVWIMAVLAIVAGPATNYMLKKYWSIA